MKHIDGTSYGLVFLAISIKVKANIQNAISKKSELPLEKLFETIKESRLWHWRPIQHLKLTESKVGDICTAMFVYDEKYQDFKVHSFKVN